MIAHDRTRLIGWLLSFLTCILRRYHVLICPVARGLELPSLIRSAAQLRHSPNEATKLTCPDIQLGTNQLMRNLIGEQITSNVYMV